MAGLWIALAMLAAGTTASEPAAGTVIAANPMAAYYPDKARAAKLDGVVMVACNVRVDARFEACRVVREMPAGYGFGAATLKMVADIGQADMKVNKPGDVVNATIKWRYTPEMTKAPAK